jgi:hypothetical protein
MKPAQIISYIVFIAIVLVIIFLDPLNIENFEPFDQEDLRGEELDAYRPSFDQDRQDPYALVLKEFQEKGVIIAGSFSQYAVLRDEARFVSRLIPQLADTGLELIAIQELRVQDNVQISDLMNQANFNEALAKQLIFQWNPIWAYEETLALLRAIWETKTSINPNLRVIGLSIDQDFSVLNTVDDLQNPEKIKQVMAPGNPEEVMAKIIIDEVFETGKKALILVERNHSFHRFQEPELRIQMEQLEIAETRQMGKILWDAYPNKFAVIGFHSPWPNNLSQSRATRPVRGVFDSFLKADNDQDIVTQFPFGIDLRSSKLGEVPIRGSNYSIGLENTETGSSLQFNDMMDIYIVLSELKNLRVSNIIPEFINEENLEKAKETFPGVKPEQGIAAQDMMDFINETRNNLNSVFLSFE